MLYKVCKLTTEESWMAGLQRKLEPEVASLNEFFDSDFGLIPKMRVKGIVTFTTIMAGSAVPSYTISGLHYDPTLSDLEASSDVYVL